MTTADAERRVRTTVPHCDGELAVVASIYAAYDQQRLLRIDVVRIMLHISQMSYVYDINAR